MLAGMLPRPVAVVFVAVVASLALGCASGGSRGTGRRFDGGGTLDGGGPGPADGGAASDGGVTPAMDGMTPPPSDSGPSMVDATMPPIDAGPACLSAGCHPMATCDDSSGTAVCACAPGYMGDGRSCTDVDECAAGTDDCSANATCTNIDGRFTCACNAGYTGDGRLCNDVDECAMGTAGCSTNATCTNRAGSFTCTCNAGFAGDGITCTATSTCTVVEGFEAGTWPVSPWTAVTAGGSVSTTAAHDGTYGITDPEWHYRISPTTGAIGERIRAWVRPGSGRAYIGFAASSGGARSFVVAPNTGDIRFQDNPGWAYTELTTTLTTITAGRWYLAEIEFASGNRVIGRLFDSDGTTLVATVEHTFASPSTGGLALRTFLGFAVDTIQICR